MFLDNCALIIMAKVSSSILSLGLSVCLAFCPYPLNLLFCTIFSSREVLSFLILYGRIVARDTSLLEGTLWFGLNFSPFCTVYLCWIYRQFAKINSSSFWPCLTRPLFFQTTTNFKSTDASTTTVSNNGRWQGKPLGGKSCWKNSCLYTFCKAHFFFIIHRWEAKAL